MRGKFLLINVFLVFILVFIKIDVAQAASDLKLTIQRDANDNLLITKNSITIKWEKLSEVVKYRITVSDNVNTYTYNTIQEETTYTINGLKSSTIYSIKLEALNINDELIESDFIYALTQYDLKASAVEQFPIPEGRGGEKPEIEIKWDKINNNFSNDFSFNGYNIFVSKKIDRSDANKYLVKANDLSLYKYIVDNDQPIPLRLVYNSVYQSAYYVGTQLKINLHNKYDNILIDELKPGTMYYIYMEPDITKYTNIPLYYKPLTNINCPTLIEINAAKVLETQNQDGVLGALVRVQWASVDPGSYKTNEIQYRVYMATNPDDLQIYNLPLKNIFAVTSYFQNEAFKSWLPMDVDYYFVVEAVFADGIMKIPSQKIKVSVKSLADVPSIIEDFNVSALSKDTVQISFKKPVQDDVYFAYQIYYSDTYQDQFDLSGNPTVYKLVYEDPENSNLNTGGLMYTDFVYDASNNTYYYNLDNLKPNTVYYFKIRVVNIKTTTKSNFSIVCVATTKLDEKIIVPTVTQAFFNKGSNQFEIEIVPIDKKWISNVNYQVLNYMVYVAENTYSVDNLNLYLEVSEDELVQNQNKVIISNNIKPNTSYYVRFKVKIIVDGTEYLSAFSKAFVVTTNPDSISLPDLSIPPIPSNFVVDDVYGVTPTSVKLKWDKLPNQQYILMRTNKKFGNQQMTYNDTIKYIIEQLKKSVLIYENINGNYVLSQRVNPDGITNPDVFAYIYLNVNPPFLDANLSPNTVFYYYLKAIENQKESSWGGLSVTTEVIEKPSNLSVYSRSADGHGIFLQWTGNIEYGYQIFVKSEKDNDFWSAYSGNLQPQSLVNASLGIFSYYVGNLKSNTLYYFKVRSIHVATGKVSPPTDIIAARTLFNQADFDESAREEKKKEEDANLLLKLQKQVFYAMEDSREKYYLLINSENALNQLDRPNLDTFVIDFTSSNNKATLCYAKMEYRILNKAIKLNKNIAIKFFNSYFIIPPDSLNTTEVNSLVTKYNTNIDYINILFEVGYLNYTPYVNEYTADSKPIYIKVWANYALAGDVQINKLSKPMNVVLNYSTIIRNPGEYRIGFIEKLWKPVLDVTHNPDNMTVSFDTVEIGGFCVLKGENLLLEKSKYSQEIYYLNQKYALSDIIPKIYSKVDYASFDYILNKVFSCSITDYKKDIKEILSQDAVYILAKVFESKKGIKIDNIQKTSTLNKDIYFEYKDAINAMLSLDVIDSSFEPSRSIIISELLHYIYNVEKLINK